MAKSKIVWIVLGSLVLIGGLVAGIFLVSRNQNIREKAAPATTLSIVPGSQNKSPNDSFSLAVEMNTGENQSMGFDLDINFNPQIFQVGSIGAGSAGSDFSVLTSNIDNTGGKISYSAFTADTTKALNGSNLNILSISGTVKASAAAGTYNFAFDSSTTVMGYQESQNVLVGTTPGSIVIAGAADQPTATPTPTVAPTATPTVTPTSAPGATKTPTPMPTGTTASISTPVTVSTDSPSLPESGISVPTFFGVGIGITLLAVSVLLAF
jgi:hypothetical protein